MADLKTNFHIMLDDAQRAQVRAWYGRGGRATRKEIKRWVQDVLAKALADLPQPKRRTVRVVATVAAPVQDMAATCGTCQQPRSEHVGRLQHCPLSKRVKPGARFTPVTKEEGR